MVFERIILALGLLAMGFSVKIVIDLYRFRRQAKQASLIWNNYLRGRKFRKTELQKYRDVHH